MKYLSVLVFFFCSTLLAATFVHPTEGFRFEYDDKHWGISSNKVPTIEKSEKNKFRTLVALQRKKPDDGYFARFSVVAQSLEPFKKKSKKPLQAYHQHGVDFLKSQRFGNFESRQGKKILPKVPGTAFETVANQRDYGLTFKQIVFARGNDAFQLTAGTRTDKFPSYQKEINQILMSFSFSPNPKKEANGQ